MNIFVNPAQDFQLPGARGTTTSPLEICCEAEGSRKGKEKMKTKIGKVDPNFTFP